MADQLGGITWAAPVIRISGRRRSTRSPAAGVRFDRARSCRAACGAQPDELLHRSLPDLARRNLEPRAAVRGRGHAGRDAARCRPLARARRQDARDARYRGRARGGSRSTAAPSWACCSRAAASRRWTATTATAGPAPNRATRRSCARTATPATIHQTSHVISAIDADGRVVSGWHMRNVHLPARVRDEHSETAYMTDRAMDYIDRMGSRPWVLHLSYVKPHWPYLAPWPGMRATRHADRCLPVIRHRDELERPHPVVAAYRRHEESVSFQRDDCIRTVRPAYQGLIAQLDHHLGRLFDRMAATGVLDDTLVICTSDHGDFLGDHWLGRRSSSRRRAEGAVDRRRSASGGRRDARFGRIASGRVGRSRSHDPRRAGSPHAGAPPGRREPAAAAARPRTHGLARLRLQRARLQLSSRAPRAGQGCPPVPRGQPARPALALRVLAGRARQLSTSTRTRRSSTIWAPTRSPRGCARVSGRGCSISSRAASIASR